MAIKDILTSEECEKSVEEVWMNLKEYTYPHQPINENDIESLKNVDQLVKKFGLIGGGMPVLYP